MQVSWITTLLSSGSTGLACSHTHRARFSLVGFERPSISGEPSSYWNSMALALSLALQVTGQGKWGNFVAQWVPTWLIIGMYNKLVKLEGHDQQDRGGSYTSGYSS